MELLIQYGVDVALIIVFAVCIIVSMRKGFLSSLLSVVCVLLSIAAATVFSEPLAQLCYDNVLDNAVTVKVEESLGEGLESIDQALNAESVNQVIPDFLNEGIAKLGIDTDSVIQSLEATDLSLHDIASKISQQIIRPAAIVILKIIAFILIYAVARFLLGLVAKFLSGAAKLPFLKDVNKWLGAIFGAVKGLAIVVALCILLGLYSYLVENTNVFARAIENSNICGIISDVDFVGMLSADNINISLN